MRSKPIWNTKMREALDYIKTQDLPMIANAARETWAFAWAPFVFLAIALIVGYAS
jgi:hypothetical protein